jgi:hypothetical protein
MFRMEGRQDFAGRNYTEEFSQVQNYVRGVRMKTPSRPYPSSLDLKESKKRSTRLNDHHV